MFAFLRNIWDALERGQRFVTHDVWRIGQPGEPLPQGFIIRHIRVAILLVKGVVRDDLLLRASALTFATMLAIVPFLALMFFMIQTFNLGDTLTSLFSTGGPSPETAAMSVQDKNREVWNEFIALLFQGFDQTEAAPAGQPVSNAVEMLVQWAEKSTSTGTITSAGVIFVLTTVIGLMMNVEGSFNTIWGVRNTRSWFRMFSNYLMVVLLLPFLVGGAVSAVALLKEAGISGRLGSFATGLRGIQYAGSWLIFTILYRMVPNTRVRFRYALLAGIVAGTAWCLLSALFVKFQFGLYRYSLLYSALAQVPVLLMWVYSSWLVLLGGAELAFAYQNESTFAMERFADNATYAYKEAIGLWTMVELARRFDSGLPGLCSEEAAKLWNVPARLLNETLRELEEARLVVQCASNPPTYQPSRSIEKITAADIMDCMRESGRDPSELRHHQEFKALVETVRECDNGQCTLAQLIRDLPPGEQSSEGQESQQGA